jgi:methyl-accepting chemotaxis protein
MKISVKIYAIVAVMGVVTLAIGAMSAYVATEYYARMEQVQTEAHKVHLGEQLNRHVTAVVMDSRGIYASATTQQATQFADGIMASLDRIDAVLAEWDPLVSAEERPAFDAVVSRAAEFRQFRTETARLGRDVNPVLANQQGNNEENRANRRAFQEEIDLVVETDQANMQGLVADTRQFQERMLIQIGAALLLGLGIGSFVAWYIARSQISRPITALTASMSRLAEGDLEVEVPYAGRSDEIGTMAGTLQVFKDNGRKVAALTEEERARAEQTATRAQTMESFQAEFDTVVAASLEGDFSRRIAGQFADADISRIAGNFNGLLSSVESGLNEAGSVLSALARTDLRSRMQGDYRGAFHALKTDINRVADTLTDVVGRLRATSRAVKSATGEILAGANDLSERTTKQAATIEETSAAMEQLASTVMANAERARNASTNAVEVTRAAEEGGQVMADANSAMERITASSGKISNIIGMIDDIAFQTNLLALNASVEAARAGDAGKGFAVVAVEVRRLAQSAAGASAEVKALIEQSATEVGTGSRLVSSAADRLTTMLEAIRQNTALMESIAHDSREQASAIEEVNVAVRQMDEMTQHNAALVEETNAAIEQTESQASELDRIVAVFNTGDELAAEPQLVAHAPAPRAQKARTAYLTQGNAALKQDWSEF